MEPKEILKKAQELVDAYEKLNIEDTSYEIPVLRLFIQAIHPGLTIRIFPRD